MQPTNEYYEKMKNLHTAIITAGLTAVVLIVLFSLAWPKPVQAKLAAMPTQLDLGGVQWRVEVVDYPGDLGSTLGYTRCDTHRIQIKRGLVDARETLLHEMMHGYVCGNGLQAFDVANLYYNSDSEAKHDGIDAVAYVIEDVIERNPGLAPYLAGGGK
jgi:hypothetical protein